MSEQKAPMAPVPRWVRLCGVLWKIIAYLGTVVVLGAVASLIGTWLTSPQGRLPADAPLSALLTHWPITLLVGCCLLLVAVVIWTMSRQNTPALQMHLPTTQDRQRMLGRLRLRYEQIRTQSLQGVVQVELGLASRPAAVENAASLFWRLSDQPEQLLPPHTPIREAYDMAHQELLILGEPGVGKSTLLLELAQHLVQQAEQDVTQPLPVLLPLSSWAVSRRPLQDWLTEQLTRLYDVPRSLSQQWIQAEQVLPLLDGLDEMEESARAACIAAINLYHRDHLLPLVVCSRTDEYEIASLDQRLALHGAVVVQPLTHEEVDAHLERLGKPLAGLRAALRKNPVLRELATTPLMLHVLILTYHGTSVRELSRKEAELRGQIWDDYVQHMVSRKGDAKRYPLHVTSAWLSWLAREMRGHNQTIFFLELLQPDWLPKKLEACYRWSTGLTVGLVAGLFFGLVSMPFFVQTGKLFYGRLGALFFGLSCGLILGLFGSYKKNIEPVDIFIWDWKKAKSGIIGVLKINMIISFGCGLFFGLIGTLVSGVKFGLFFGLAIVLVLGSISSLIFGPLNFLLTGFSGKQLAKRSTRVPNEGMRRSTKNGLIGGVVFGLGFGLFIWLGNGLLNRLMGGFREAINAAASGLSFGLGVGLTIGLVSVLILGLGFGWLAVVQHFILRFWLRCAYTFPLKAVPFLEDATVRILLRRVGGGYSFTHRLLLDHFADRTPLASSAPAAAHLIEPPSKQLPSS